MSFSGSYLKCQNYDIYSELTDKSLVSVDVERWSSGSRKCYQHALIRRQTTIVRHFKTKSSCI